MKTELNTRYTVSRKANFITTCDSLSTNIIWIYTYFEYEAMARGYSMKEKEGILFFD